MGARSPKPPAVSIPRPPPPSPPRESICFPWAGSLTARRRWTWRWTWKAEGLRLRLFAGEFSDHDGIDLSAQSRRFLGGSNPDDWPFDCEVGMDGDIAESHDIAPWDLRIPRGESRVKLRGGFTNDGELLEHRALQHVVL